MFVQLGFLVSLALLLQQSPVPAGPLAAPAVFQKLRSTTSDIAKTGQLRLVQRMTAVLAGLGDDPEDLERLARGWEKSVSNAKPTRSTGTSAASKLRRELMPLVEQLASVDGPRRSELARWILELDSGQPAANAALEREQDATGEWLTREERSWRLGAQRDTELLRVAGALEFEVAHGESDNPALKKLRGSANVARARGIELHAELAPERLERVLGQALRAMALSNGVLSGQLELHKGLRPWKFVLLDSDELLLSALEEAREAKAIAPEEYDAFRELRLRSFIDARGWRTSRWRSEAELEALILWDSSRSWLGRAQPCLRVGHLNWVCLSFLGSSIPMSAWREEVAGSAASEHTTAKLDEQRLRQSLWRCARQSLFGCRAWMMRAVREKRDPPWVRAMLDQDGKIRDENLLKTTLVCELLQQEGRLWPVMESTREKPTPSAAIEKALGEPLPEFEGRWRRWLDPPRRSGVLQELELGAPAPEGESPFAAAMLILNQSRANALKDQAPEVPIVALEPELCRAAELHARYLTLNPEQKTKWPAAHEEYVGAPGFTPAGSLSGGHSVIAFDGDAVKAVEGWLGTFFHRLPLLDPGLFGAGFGTSEEVVVLDVRSLVLTPWQDHVVVWPLSEAQDVPRSFVPELPNPVPSADMASLGYPITVQLFFRESTGRSAQALELELFAGAPQPEHTVACHEITPDAPLQVQLAPENAWCLIPKQPLKKKTLYTARATWADQVKVWSFTTGD